MEYVYLGIRLFFLFIFFTKTSNLIGYSEEVEHKN